MSGLPLVHHRYGRSRKEFRADRNTRSTCGYRWWNEVSNVTMLTIVFRLEIRRRAFAGPFASLGALEQV